MKILKSLFGLCCILLLALSFTSCSSRVARQSNPPMQTRPVYVPPPKQTSDFILKDNAVQSVNEVGLKPLSKKPLIIVDPGHGGEDFGTKSLTRPKYHEKSLNLTTALILNDFLQQMGYRTLMTRSKDEFITLLRRAEFANENNADLFVSVHYNSAPAKEADGIEIFYYKLDENKARVNESRKLASNILTKVLKNTEARSRGVKDANFAVIRETKMPAVLIEGGFLTNENELDKIKDPAYVKSLAWGIAQGIQSYLNSRR
jgi:N-acetylmuramoyl-L-alanine amidase